MEPRLVFERTVQYPVAMELRYKIRARPPRVGVGQTRWMSSREVNFTADQPIERGTSLEMSIAWPALLHNRVALQLVVEAEITDFRDGTLTAHIMKHHFRTRGQWPREVGTEQTRPAYSRPVPMRREAVIAQANGIASASALACLQLAPDGAEERGVE